MKVHNIMEEYVESRVNTFYDRLNQEKASWLTCDCDICRSDAISYVLNRIPPRYVVSARGVNHSSELMNNTQLRADVDTLTSQGVHLINSVQRPYHTPQQKRQQNVEKAQIPSFNFPVFTGTVYDGASFESLANVTVSLKTPEGELATMFDTTWENPCCTFKVTNGTYSFWVEPLCADKVGESKNFHFTLEASLPGYTPVSYGFDVPVISEENRRETMDSSCSLKMPDLFMFSADEIV